MPIGQFALYFLTEILFPVGSELYQVGKTNYYYKAEIVYASNPSTHGVGADRSLELEANFIDS